ncbi:MAG: hypothetical protein CM1200mP34_2870 [Verrucomicrobiales bacterium]|nr:MAG: hypothetical protein CM1200mP34_2870 [Verrucomicrobiales bacterium]
MPTPTNTHSGALVLPDPADATNAVGQGEIPDIRGLKDLADIPTGHEWLWWVLVAVATLVIVAVIAWFVRRQLASATRNWRRPHRRLRTLLHGIGCSVRLA